MFVTTFNSQLPEDIFTLIGTLFINSDTKCTRMEGNKGIPLYTQMYYKDVFKKIYTICFKSKITLRKATSPYLTKVFSNVTTGDWPNYGQCTMFRTIDQEINQFHNSIFAVVV